MTMMPATVSPVPFRSATPRLRSGPSVTVPTSRTRTGTPLSFRASTISPISSADLAYAHVVVAGPHGVDDLRDGHVEGAQAIRVDRHLVLPDESAERRDFGDARNRLQVVAEIPVLVRTQLSQAGAAGRVDERVLKHPAHAGRIGTEFGADALWQSREDAREVLQRARAGPVDVLSLIHI